MAFGMKERDLCFFGRGMAFEIVTEDEKETPPVKIVAAYPDEPLLVSGWLTGGERIRGKGAIVDLPVGKGRIALFGFNVQNRAQAWSTMKLLMNATYYR